MAEKPDFFYIQSAVIPYRAGDQGWDVLLVTSRRKKRWIVPKGIVEPGMGAGPSAAKEAWEEAGVTGEVSTLPIGRYTYIKWGGPCRVSVYLLQVTHVLADWPESFRDRIWLPHERAAGRVREPELARMLHRLPTHIQAGFDRQVV